MFLLLTLGVGAAALNTGNNLLYVAFCMNLSLIILSGVLSEWCLRRVTVRLRAAGEAFARTDGLLAVACATAGKRFPSISLAVSLAFEEDRVTARFPHIPAGSGAVRILPFRPDRRGPLSPASCTVSTRFPFALFEKSADVEPQGSLLVYPEASGADFPEAGGTAAGLSAAAPLGRQGDAIRGAREQVPADPVRDIHWKASARLGKWMVKEREGEASPAADLRLPVPSPPEEFEQAVSRVCAQLLRCEKAGRPYRLWIGDRVRVGEGHPGRRTRALSLLAIVRSDGSVPGGFSRPGKDGP